jgi:transposase-like protein/transposase Tn5 family protein/DDE family transposase
MQARRRRGLGVLDPEVWAEQQFGTVELGDPRRTRRLVQIAARMLRRPQAPLPQQLRRGKQLKAAYRLWRQRALTHARIQGPHWAQTRATAARERVTLFVHDSTAIDHTAHPETDGLGRISPKGYERGYHLHTTLAVRPEDRRVLGVAYAQPWVRQPTPVGETATQRRQRPRESARWPAAVHAIGPPPAPVDVPSPGSGAGETPGPPAPAPAPAPGGARRWVHVADAEADDFPFLHACRQTGTDFLVRVAQDRCVETAEGYEDRLLRVARALPVQDTRELAVPAQAARPGRPAQAGRTARVSLGWTRLVVWPPGHPPGPPPPPLVAWVVRVWEPHPPAGVEPLEWVLLTSVPTETLADAWARVDWYTCRWLVEEYHTCLKTGCALERRHLLTVAALWRQLALLALVAVRLLQLRDLARHNPSRLARSALPPALLAVVAALAAVDLDAQDAFDPRTGTLARFWRTVARLGGYLGRRGDGPPGWQTLWRGWQEVQTVLHGVQLVAALPP